MKFICSLDDCNHIFNDMRGLKKHYKQIHGLESDYKQYLKPFTINNTEKTLNDDENPLNDDEKDEIPPLLAQDLNAKLPESEGLNAEFKEIFELTSIRKRLARERFIEGMYNKLTRDLNRDEDFYTPDQIDTEQLKQELRQELTPVQVMENQNPTQATLMSNFIEKLAPHIPNIINNLTKSTNSGGNIPW